MWDYSKGGKYIVNQNFEESMIRLDEIIELLNSKEISLNDSVKLYKEGVDLYTYMKNLIHVAEKEVKTISIGLDGDFFKEDFVEIDE